MIANPPDALLIFARWPEPGRVKTRLSPPLPPAEAALLYRCMLEDTLDSTGRLECVKRMLFFDGEPERAYYFRSLAPDAEVMRQSGADLGERLAHAFISASALGYARVAVIGSDSPHMPVERITEAFSLLDGDRTDVVFGPSGDGGYYLVAMKKPQPKLFKGIPWSSADTLATSIARSGDLGLRTALLATCYDLDTVEDLMRLKNNAAHATSAPRTLLFLSRI